MSGAKSVRKGKRYERRVAVELRKVFSDSGRCLQFQRAHGAPDVRAGPLWVEVKGRQVPAVRTWKAADAAMRAAGACASDVAALVMPSGGTGPLLITLPLRDLIELLKIGISCPKCGGGRDDLCDGCREYPGEDF